MQVHKALKLSLPKMINLIDSKIDVDHFTLTVAAVLHPYQKRDILQKYHLVEPKIIELLEDEALDDFIKEYDNQVHQNVEEDLNETTIIAETGARKKLRFDEMVEINSRTPNESAKDEWNRYKESRLNLVDVEILFGKKVL
jgi:predicted TIM-barrel fold metal-dependent hydrolase